MRFNRLDLITRIETEIERRETDARTKTVKAVQEYEKDREQFIRDTSETWRLFANKVRRRVANGEPVIREDIPKQIRGNYDHLPFWTRTEPSHRANVDGLRSLLLLLQATDDEFVTFTALDRMGFKTINLFQS